MRYVMTAASAMTFVLLAVAPQRAEAIQFTSNLLMHFDAANVQTSGSSVTRWYNQGTAGATLDALQTAVAPTLVNGALNGMPVVRFNSAVDNTLRTGALGSDVAQPLTIIHVGLKTTATGAPFFYDGRVDLKRAAFYNETATVTSIYGGTGAVSASPAPLNSFDAWTGVFNGTQSFINRNGGTFGGPASIGTNPIDGMTIGARFNAANRMNGDIAEIAVFTGLLNAAQMKIASNHYSAKYQLPVATNLYNGDNNGAGGYDFNVFGIGNSGAITGFAAGTVTTGTEGDGLILTANSSLDINDFVLAGNQDQANGLTTDDVPNDYIRWERVWNIDQTGSVNVELKFDSIAAGLGALEPGRSYELLYSSTDPYNFSVLSTNDIVVGNTVSFSLLGAQLADGFYTLSVSPPAPEPSTTLLVGLGLCGFAALRRRQRIQKYADQ
jgi:hypothetical protein